MPSPWISRMMREFRIEDMIEAEREDAEPTGCPVCGHTGAPFILSDERQSIAICAVCGYDGN